MTAKTFLIPVSNGLLEHCSKMGDAIWLFLWLVDRTTKEKDDKGKVLGGMPIRDRDIADTLGGITDRTIRRWRRRLIDGGYIEAINTGHGYSYRVLKSKKWSKKDTSRPDKNVRSDRPQSTSLIDQNGHSDRPQSTSLYRQHRDKAVDSSESTTAAVSESQMESELLKVWSYYLEAFDKEEILSPSAKKAGMTVLSKLRQRHPAASSEQCVEGMTAAIDRARHIVKTQPKKLFFASWHAIFGKFETFYSLWEEA